MAPDDLRDFPLPEARPLTGDAGDETTFALDPVTVALPFSERPEPRFDSGPVMVGFDEPEPVEAENEPDHPDRHFVRSEPESQAPRSTEWQRSWAVDLAAAGVVHVLTLLLLLPWPLMPTEIARPIPVQLVLEQPPPTPAPPPERKPEAKPPPGRLASTDIGDPTAKPAKPAAAPEPPVEQPQKLHAVAKTAPQKAPRPPELVSALRMPARMLGPEIKLLDPSPRASALKVPVKHEAAVRPAPHPLAATPWGRIPGPTATEDEYLAYANALIRRNQEMIPGALLRGRNGTAVINILVLADGTIAQIAIKESSGYPEIDQRAEQMVAAVKRFPPLPQWFRGTGITLSYHMLFGNRMVLPESP